jgi:RNA polymerase sigma-70 factor (ECF subfamily)
MALRMRWNDAITTIAPAERPVAAPPARAGIERSTFDELYRAYLTPIYGYCYRRLGNTHAAEDATQQVFTQAYARLHTCHADSVRGWLFAIAHNVTAAAVRARRPEASLDVADELPAATASPEELAISADLTTRLRAAMRELTREQRDVLDLRYSGVGIGETAAILRTSEGAVKQLQHRAMLRLRALLVDETNGQVGRHG